MLFQGGPKRRIVAMPRWTGSTGARRTRGEPRCRGRKPERT